MEFSELVSLSYVEKRLIMDPYQIITWVPPEGGGGPNYDGM